MKEGEEVEGERYKAKKINKPVAAAFEKFSGSLVHL